jgi:glycosyltransferase involved in cell wall biosynthesis
MADDMVSIIIPTYNYGHLIAQTLTCLISQTYNNWEAIIVDDGSNDDTDGIVQSFLNSDSRFSYIKQVNQGVAEARNLGLKLAKGDFIQFVDADDLISEKKLELQISYLEANPRVDICVTNSRYFETSNPKMLYSDFTLRNKTSVLPVHGCGYQVISDFLIRNPLVIQSPLIKRGVIDTIGNFRKGMHYLEDWDFWFRAATANFCFGFLDHNSAIALVRVHKESASQQSVKIIEAEISFRDLATDNLLQSNLIEAEKMKLIKRNDELRIDTYKKIMAYTHLYELSKYVRYYKEMPSTAAFLKAFIKAINLKRKLFTQ